MGKPVKKVFIFAFLLFTFRSFKSTFLALLPLLAGTLWTLGLMYLFGVDLNLANSLFMPLVVGAGVEYGIIILHRWRQKEKNKAGIVLPFNTAMGVILAGLTTTVGFCSLCISSHQGIFSLGVLTTIGSLCILTAAVLFLPAVLQFFFESSPEAEEPNDAPP
ncbi:MAG: MMPL family transporter [Syntrophales bacterium LBB04]|nr:MMPL family transporter [Syntrophales bacterium LBB04]